MLCEVMLWWCCWFSWPVVSWAHSCCSSCSVVSSEQLKHMLTLGNVMGGEVGVEEACLSDYFADITYVDRLTHLFLALYLVVVLVRLLRASDMKFSICDAHLIDAVCQISTVFLVFAGFRILRKENFNMQIPITSVLMTVLGMITTFTFGISVGRSWGMAEAMLQVGDVTSNVTKKSKNKRVIRPKLNTAVVNNQAYSSDDSSFKGYSSPTKRVASKSYRDSPVPTQVKSASLVSQEEEDKKKILENEIVQTICDTVQSAKEKLFSNLELNLVSSGPHSPTKNNPSEWKLVRTGHSSHIWQSKHTNDRKNNLIIKASCFSVMSVKDVTYFLHENEITTGLECIFKDSSTIQTLKNKRVQVRRLSVGSTLAVAKRDFVAATHWLEIPDTHSIVICTQSMPDSYSPKVKGVTRGKIHNCGFVIIPAAKAPAASRRPNSALSVPTSASTPEIDDSVDIRYWIDGRVSSTEYKSKLCDERGCQVLYFTEIELGGTSGMAMRRSIARKGDAIINSLHALMDQLHSKIPRFQDVSFENNKLTWASDSETDNVATESRPSVLDCVFQELPENTSGGLTHNQILELRTLSKKTSDRLKNLYCNAVGLVGSADVISNSLPGVHKSSVANMDEVIGDDAGGTVAKFPRHPQSPPPTSHWTTFHDQDGISVSEYSDSDYPMDTLMASCHVEAAPHEVRRLLTENPEYVDGLLEQRDVLYRLDNRTSVQWIAYGAMWPIGARDFLVLTSESTFNSEKPFDDDQNTFHDSFILVSTSVDSIYEDIIESSVNEEGDDQDTYTRSYLRLAGYIGTRNNKNGGTDLRLFINLDIATYIPAWVMQIMSQYGLSEMMNRIRTALSADKISEFRHMTQLGNSNASRLHGRAGPSKLNTIMTKIKDREEKLKHMAPSNQQLGELPIETTSERVDSVDIDVGGGSLVNTELMSESSDIIKGKELAAHSLHMLKIYAGLEISSEHIFDWQVKSKKGPIQVSTSITANSSWIALRATTVIDADTITLRNFLFDDANLSSIDDMLDNLKPVLKVDDCTSIRHLTFKGVWPTAPRDFVLCTTLSCDETKDGITRSFIASKSAWDGLLPPQDGFVRGTLLISGYVIGAVEGNPNASHITMCAHSDLGGQLPSSLINALSVNAPVKLLTAVSEVLRSRK